jgi:hypothetical protein
MFKFFIYLLGKATNKAVQTYCYIKLLRGLVWPWLLEVTLFDAWEFPIE